MEWAMPDCSEIRWATVISLKDPFNLVILFNSEPRVNWQEVRLLAWEPTMNLPTIKISNSAWSYRCCDYSVGAMLGMIESLTNKKFKEIASDGTVEGIRFKRYQLV